MPIHVNAGLVIPDGELSMKFAPSGGPGGQHANKAHTRVELVWDVSRSHVVTEHQRTILLRRFGAEVRVSADDERSQARNRQIAHERIGRVVREALRPRKSRTATKPTRGSKRRRVEGERQRSQTKSLRRKPGHDD